MVSLNRWVELPDGPAPTRNFTYLNEQHSSEAPCGFCQLAVNTVCTQCIPMDYGMQRRQQSQVKCPPKSSSPSHYQPILSKPQPSSHRKQGQDEARRADGFE